MKRSPSFFAALDLEGKSCLVVGSDAEAERRVSALLECGAHVLLVADTPSQGLLALEKAGRIELRQRGFLPEDMKDCWLAILAIRDKALALEMGRLAQTERVFFCAIDLPANNSFAHMAQARAGFVTAAISTEGRAPALGRKLRDELQGLFDRSNLANFADKIARLRAQTAPETRARVLSVAVSGVRLEGALHVEE